MFTRFVILLGVLGQVLFLTGLPAPALDPGDEKIYANLLPSTVWIAAPHGTGSGALVDEKRKWVVTNYHVVQSEPEVTVFFPVREEGRLVTNRDSYLKNGAKHGIGGQVIARFRHLDLAIVELPELPAGAKALPLAGYSAGPAQSVHSIGNPGASPALWVYTSGRVRRVLYDTWKARVGQRILTFSAQVLMTQSPINPGDSGGPVVNDQSELIGIVSCTNLEAQLISYCIDVAEVRFMLAWMAMGRDEPGIQGHLAGGAETRIEGEWKETDPEESAWWTKLEKGSRAFEHMFLAGGSYTITLQHDIPFDAKTERSPASVYVLFKNPGPRLIWTTFISPHMGNPCLVSLESVCDDSYYVVAGSPKPGKFTLYIEAEPCLVSEVTKKDLPIEGKPFHVKVLPKFPLQAGRPYDITIAGLGDQPYSRFKGSPGRQNYLYPTAKYYTYDNPAGQLVGWRVTDTHAMEFTYRPSRTGYYGFGVLAATSPEYRKSNPEEKDSRKDYGSFSLRIR